MRAYILCALAVLCGLAAWAVAVTPLAPPVNLVVNGDFEQAGQAGAAVAGWRTPLAGGGLAIQDATVKHGGAASLKLAVQAKGNVSTISDSFAVKPETYYLFTVAYRAEGFGDKGFVGANCSTRIIFQDEKNATLQPPMGNLKAGFPWAVGFPYTDVPEWKTVVMLAYAPVGTVKACVQIGVANTKEDMNVTVWLDDVKVREYTPAEAKGKTYTFKPKTQLNLYNSELVDGCAVATKDKQKAGTLVGGPYVKDLPCGLYAVTYRLKTADNTIPTALVQLVVDAEGVLGQRATVQVVKGTDFKAPDTLQDLTVQAFKPPTGYLAFPIVWSGDATVTLESVTVTEIKTMTADEWTAWLQ